MIRRRANTSGQNAKLLIKNQLVLKLFVSNDYQIRLNLHHLHNLAKNCFCIILEVIVQCRKRNSKGETENGYNFFDKTWESYKNGFGEIGTDYWVGLESLYEMTSQDLTWKLEVGDSPDFYKFCTDYFHCYNPLYLLRIHYLITSSK